MTWLGPTRATRHWLGLQMDYELDVAEDMLEGRLEEEVTPTSATGQT